MSDNREGTRTFYDQFGYTVPAVFDVDQEVAGIRYGVIATPTNYLLDASGRIVWRHYGFRPGDEIDMREQITRILEAPS